VIASLRPWLVESPETLPESSGGDPNGTTVYEFLAALAASLSLLTGPVTLSTWREAVPFRSVIVAHIPPELAPEVDLRPKIAAYRLHVRDQGSRGTCTVFATAFLIEYQRAGLADAPHRLDLSEEYLNWAGNKATGEDADGGFFTKEIAGYNAWGISTAREMPNQATYDAANPDTPSQTVIAKAAALFPQRYRTSYPFEIVKVWDNTKGMNAAELKKTLTILRSGRPVASGMWWQNNFATVSVRGVPLLKYYSRSANTGANPPMFDGHTIDLVGFRESRAFPDGGYFIFRNSWGTSFGDKGYGFVSFRYIRTWANDAIAVTTGPHFALPTHSNPNLKL
jgi:hypothetical protein